jgi:hypothetical protein
LGRYRFWYNKHSFKHHIYNFYNIIVINTDWKFPIMLYSEACLNPPRYNWNIVENGIKCLNPLTSVVGQYGKDYITQDNMTFATVFSILFSSVTGILNGANMSGKFTY